MLLIETRPQETTEEPFKSYFEAFKSAGLSVPLPLQLMSGGGPLFNALTGFLNCYVDHPVLSRPLCAAIRFHTASRSNFPACIEFNKSLLEKLGMVDDLASLKNEHPTASALSPEEQRILTFVADALWRPRSIDKARIDSFKNDGVTGEILLQAVVHGALLLMSGPVVAAFSSRGD